jgi:hypothetical protein
VQGIREKQFGAALVEGHVAELLSQLSIAVPAGIVLAV